MYNYPRIGQIEITPRGPIVRSDIPRLQTPIPQRNILSSIELNYINRFIPYLDASILNFPDNIPPLSIQNVYGADPMSKTIMERFLNYFWNDKSALFLLYELYNTKAGFHQFRNSVYPTTGDVQNAYFWYQFRNLIRDRFKQLPWWPGEVLDR